MLKWLRTAGIGAEGFGWGGLLLANSFWPAVSLIYAGFVAVGVDLWLEPELANRQRWRVGGLALIIVFVAWFSFGVVFTKAPLNVSAFMTDAEYPAGTVIAGIQWKPQFTEVQLSIYNGSGDGYDDLNIIVRPTSAIAAIAQSTNIPGVSWQDRLEFVPRLMAVDLNKKQSTAMPLDLLATDAGYIIRCPHLPATTAIKFVLAAADVRWDPPIQCSSLIPQEERLKNKDCILKIKMGDKTRLGDFSTYWEGHADGNVYTERPTSEEEIAVEGTYISGHRVRRISQRIRAGGLLTIRQR
jgi:hypothetical protein